MVSIAAMPDRDQNAPVVKPPDGPIDKPAAKTRGKENTETQEIMVACGVSQKMMDEHAEKDVLVAD